MIQALGMPTPPLMPVAERADLPPGTGDFGRLVAGAAVRAPALVTPVTGLAVSPQTPPPPDAAPLSPALPKLAGDPPAPDMAMTAEVAFPPLPVGPPFPAVTAPAAPGTSDAAAEMPPDAMPPVPSAEVPPSAMPPSLPDAARGPVALAPAAVAAPAAPPPPAEPRAVASVRSTGQAPAADAPATRAAPVRGTPLRPAGAAPVPASPASAGEATRLPPPGAPKLAGVGPAPASPPADLAQPEKAASKGAPAVATALPASAGTGAEAAASADTSPEDDRTRPAQPVSAPPAKTAPARPASQRPMPEAPAAPAPPVGRDPSAVTGFAPAPESAADRADAGLPLRPPLPARKETVPAAAGAPRALPMPLVEVTQRPREAGGQPAAPRARAVASSAAPVPVMTPQPTGGAAQTLAATVVPAAVDQPGRPAAAAPALPGPAPRPAPPPAPPAPSAEAMASATPSTLATGPGTTGLPDTVYAAPPSPLAAPAGLRPAQGTAPAPQAAGVTASPPLPAAEPAPGSGATGVAGELTGKPVAKDRDRALPSVLPLAAVEVLDGAPLRPRNPEPTPPATGKAPPAPPDAPPDAPSDAPRDAGPTAAMLAALLAPARPPVSTDAGRPSAPRDPLPGGQAIPILRSVLALGVAGRAGVGVPGQPEPAAAMEPRPPEGPDLPPPTAEPPAAAVPLPSLPADFILDSPPASLELAAPEAGPAPGPAAPAGTSAAPTAVAAAPVPPQGLGALAVSIAAGPGAGTIEVTLAPAELGEVQLSLAREGEHLRVQVIAERPETLDLLRRHGDSLLADLRAAGFAQTSLSFAGRDGTAGGQDRPGGAPPDPRPPAPETPALAPPPVAATTGLHLRL